MNKENFIRGVCLAALVMVAAGCATLERHAGKAVGTYCGAVTESDQQALRLRLDKATDPHTVRINCNANKEDEHGEETGS